MHRTLCERVILVHKSGGGCGGCDGGGGGGGGEIN